jgi:flagellar M-ring protein FliF
VVDVNNFFAQLMGSGQKVWAAMSAGPRVALLSFLGIMALMVVGFSMWSSQTEYMMVYGGLTPEDAAAISTKLKDEKIPFKYETSRGAILVPPGKVDAARLLLAAQGLPKSSTEGFELFDKSSFGTTEFEQRIKYVRALSGTLARNIQAIDSVESARVSLAIPEDEVFSRDKREAKASVSVTMRSGRSMSNEQIGAIRHLVAASVPKLEPRNVSIMDSKGRLLSKLQEPGDMGAMTEEQLGMQKRVEDHLADKAQTLLDQVLGPGRAAVRVTAQLNFERAERMVQKIDPESQVTLEESVRKEETKGETKGAAGNPGVDSNTTGGTVTAQGGSTNLNNHKQSNSTSKYQYNTTSEKIIAETGAIKRLSVAVLVSSKGEPGADGQPAAEKKRDDKEMKKIEDIVKSAVGYAPERKDTVQVSEMPFSETGVAAIGLPAATTANPWVELLQRHINDVLGFFAIGVMVIVFLRLFRNTQQVVAAAAPVPVEPSPEELAAAQANAAPKLNANNVQRELQVLVGQNSNQAAAVLSTFLKK